jgi:mRNA-degrading endonuclease toxin of MazEF toxin-antitoxin module
MGMRATNSTSYASPWFLTTIKHDTIDRHIGTVTDSAVEEIREEILHYLS